ncbi:Panacea domain-containing protein [Bradyrhizobium sp. 199]|uniref:Panacea domain-containing protein n=1 Tax=Bradyrhizobium sp. 199 TaxID=2782664 RepID=UPI001FFBFDB1|nr:Panacea domain-containing protein [Bradyrhizobium sp. 199]MCK1361223.1 SocA family protein [Bradyrhizobium sp. 199]
MAPVWYNARKAAQVAAFFAKASGGKINVLKLVKLIYLADRLALETFESPILNDKFVSMDHGPVNSITLNYVNGMSDDRDEWAEFITDRSGHQIGLANSELKLHDLDELSTAELKILELVWLKHGKLNQFEIRDFTHKHCPEWEDPRGSSEPIPLERIFKFLGKTDSSALAAKVEAERNVDQLFASIDDLPTLEEGDSAYAIRAAR